MGSNTTVIFVTTLLPLFICFSHWSIQRFIQPNWPHHSTDQFPIRRNIGSALRLTSSETHFKYSHIREFRQPRRRRRYKFAYFTMKNCCFSRFARAFSICVHFEAVFVHSMTWNALFCSCVGDVRTSSRSYQFKSSIVSKRFASHATRNSRGIGKKSRITETWSYIFRWHSPCRPCLSPVFTLMETN